MGKSGNLMAKNDSCIEELLLDSRYVVCEDGTVLTSTTKQGHSGKILRKAGYKEKNGYCKLGYTPLNKKRKNLPIHRIVYAKFKGKLDPEMTINHINGVRSDNRPLNLEMVTQGKNNEHRYRVTKSGPVIGNKRINDQIAASIRADRIEGVSYKDLALKYNVCKSTISYVINRKTWNR